MDRRVRAMWLLALIAVALLCTACADDARSPSPESPSASARLLPLNSDDEGHLERVAVEGSPSVELPPAMQAPPAIKALPGQVSVEAEEYTERVWIEVPDSIRGVDTYLSVVMHWGPHTKYAVYGKPWSTLSESVKAGDEFWSSSDADIAYHFEDGGFVLDSIAVRQVHWGFPAERVSPTP